MVRIRNAASPTLIRLAVVVAVALTAAACSTSTTTSALASSGSSAGTSDPVHGSANNGSGPGGTSGADAGGSNPAGGSSARPGGSAADKDGSGATDGGASTSAAGSDSKGGHGAKNAAGPTTTTTGIPAVPQQFESDDTSFESLLDRSQTTVNHLSSTVTAGQVSFVMQPLVAAAEQYQSDIINLQWSSAAKSGSQSVSEKVGQLVADIDEVQRPHGFLSVGLFRSEFATAATAVRSSVDSLRSELGLPSVTAH